MKRFTILILLLTFAFVKVNAQQHCKAQFNFHKLSSKQVFLEAYNDSSTSNQPSFTWYFDDGSGSDNGRTITHTFPANGDYRVILAVQTDSCFDSISHMVHIFDNKTPMAFKDQFDMGDSKDFIYVNPLVNDRDDDGSLDKNSIVITLAPLHGTAMVFGTEGQIYYKADSGFYPMDSLKYTVNDMEGATSNEAVVRFKRGKVTNHCEVNYTFKANEGYNVYFQASPNAVDCTWDFGDRSQMGQGKNVNHTYLQEGTYIVCLYARDSIGNCMDTVCREIHVKNVPPCHVDFTFKVDSDGFGVKFNPVVSNNIVYFSWDFGDGHQSDRRDPYHVYNEQGNYKVCLTAYDSSGKCSAHTCETVHIGSSTNGCSAKFSYTFGKNNPGDTTQNNLTVSFENHSAGDSLTYLWSFDDGEHSSLKNPVHHYSHPGNYNVCLTISNNHCHDTFCHPVELKKSKSTIFGRVFFDKNANATRDDGEKGLEGRMIMIEPGHVKVTTNKGGEYRAVLDSGQYTVSVEIPEHWVQTKPTNPDFYTVVLSGKGNTNGLDFGIKPSDEVKDLRIKLTSFRKNGQEGNPLKYQICYRNDGGTTVNGSVDLDFDSRLYFLESNNQGYTINDTTSTISWNFTGLEPGETRRIQVTFGMDSTNVMYGDTLFSRATVNPVDEDFTPGNNSSNICTIVGGADKPNDMDDKNCDDNNGHHKNMYNAIYYTIRFQNISNATVNNVVILDTMDKGFDLSTLELLDESHDFNFQLINGNILSWDITSINLSSAAVNMQGSQGFVSFKIKPDGSVANVSNRASIYFDNNEALSTNATNSSAVVNGITSHSNTTYNVEAYPNPMNDQVTIKINDYKNKEYAIRLFDLTGREVFRLENQKTNMLTLSRNGLPSGIYFFNITDINGLQSTGKLIMQ